MSKRTLSDGELELLAERRSDEQAELQAQATVAGAPPSSLEPTRPTPISILADALALLRSRNGSLYVALADAEVCELVAVKDNEHYAMHRWGIIADLLRQLDREQQRGNLS